MFNLFKKKNKKLRGMWVSVAARMIASDAGFRYFKIHLNGKEIKPCDDIPGVKLQKGDKLVVTEVIPPERYVKQTVGEWLKSLKSEKVLDLMDIRGYECNVE